MTMSPPKPEIVWRVIEGTVPTSDHDGVRLALQAMFPDGSWVVSASQGRTEFETLVDADGRHLSSDPDEWLRCAVDEAGDFRIAWAQLRNQDLVRVRGVENDLFAYCRTGRNVLDWLQISFALQTDIDRMPAVSDVTPQVEYDLYRGDDRHIAVSTGRRYVASGRPVIALAAWAELQSINPPMSGAMLTEPLLRWFDDWEQSSAGKRDVFEFWALTELDNPRRLMFTPTQHSIRLRVPVVESIGAIELAAILKEYDRLAGFPFAWYFSLVLGGISAFVARRIYDADSAGFISMPDCDRAVLARWIEQPYRL